MQQDERPLRAQAGRDRRHDGRDGDGQSGDHRHEQAGLGRREAGLLAVEEREPAEGDVGVQRLRAEEQRERPGGAAAQHAPAAAGAARRPGCAASPHVGQPRQDGDGRQQRPGAEPDAPPARADGLGERHGPGGRGGQPDGQGGRVDGRHGADAVGEVARDQRGQQDVADRSAQQCHTAQGEEGQGRVDRRPPRQPERHQGQRGRDRAVLAEAGGQRRGVPTDHREAGHGQRREDAGELAAEPGAGLHLGEQRSDAGDGGAQVERREDDRDDERPRRARRRRRRTCVALDERAGPSHSSTPGTASRRSGRARSVQPRSGRRPAGAQSLSDSLPRSCRTALVCIWQMRLSVTPSTWPISARVRPS